MSGELELALLRKDGRIRRRCPLAPGDLLVVGRDPECDLQINEVKASRQHCKVWRSGDVVNVDDLQSTNGTQVDGQTVEGPRQIAVGGVIGVGMTRLALIPAGAEAVPAPPAAPVSFELLGDGGAWDGRRLPLPVGALLVGRQGDAAVRFTENGVSSRHATLEVGPTSVCVVDHSSNGTTVDGERIERREGLTGGERLQFGPLTFRLVRAGETPAGAAATPASAAAAEPPTEATPEPELSQSGLRGRTRPAQGRWGKVLAYVVGGVVVIGLLIRIAQQPPSTPQPPPKIVAQPDPPDPVAPPIKIEPGLPEPPPQRYTAETPLRKALKERDYDEARRLIRRYPKEIRPRLRKTYIRHQTVFTDLFGRLSTRHRAQRARPLFGFPDVLIVEVSRQAIRINLQSGQMLHYTWREMAAAELLQACRETGVERDDPLGVASLAAFQGDRKRAREILATALREQRTTKADVREMLAELDWELPVKALLVQGRGS